MVFQNRLIWAPILQLIVKKLTWDEIAESIDKYELTAYKNTAVSDWFFNPNSILKHAMQRGKLRLLHFPKSCWHTLGNSTIPLWGQQMALGGIMVERARKEVGLVLWPLAFVLVTVCISRRTSTVSTSMSISVWNTVRKEVLHLQDLEKLLEQLVGSDILDVPQIRPSLILDTC